MTLLLAFLISLLPLSALAEVQAPTGPPIHAAPQGWNVIPDGHGGVTYWRGQGGTDAYTAGIIGQGLSQMSRPAPAPRYTPPPLVALEFQYNRQADPVGDANRVFLDYLNHRSSTAHSYSEYCCHWFSPPLYFYLDLFGLTQ